MDNDFNEIDDLFKSRFEGFKDHSVSPSGQWNSFESQMNKTMAETTAQSGGFAMKSLSMAASFAAIIGITLLAQSDVSQTFDAHYAAVDQQQTLITNDGFWTINQPSPFVNGASFGRVFDLSKSTSKITNSEEELMAEHSSDQHSSPSIANVTKTELVATQESRSSISSSIIDTPTREEALTAIGKTTLRNDLAFMPLVGHNDDKALLSDSDRNIEAADYFNNSGVATDIFFRLGVRFGSGESNSSQNPNAWTANALAGIGFKRAISDKYGWMAEFAYLRRSGNGLERHQNLEVERSFSAYNTSFNAGGNNPLEVVPDFTVDRSLVADRLDYFQMPLSMYYNASQKISVNAGFYGEFLFNAQNKAYVIYNNVNYVALSTSDEEKGSVEGLNRLRYGISAGANYEIMQNLRLDVRALVPVNSTFNDNAVLCASKGANKSLDLLISLKYSI